MNRARFTCFVVIFPVLVLLGACNGDADAPGVDGRAGADDTATAAQVLPTPNESGIYQGVTIEQAQELMPFEILVPHDVPDAFELVAITADSEPLQTGEFGDAIEVSFFFTAVAGNPEDTVRVAQRRGTVILASEGERTQLDIAGVEVTRNVSSYDDGRVVAGYNWRTDEYSITVDGLLGDGVETDDLEALIEAFLN